MTAAAPVKRIPQLPATPLAFIRYLLRHCPRRVKKLMILTVLCEIVFAATFTSMSWVLGRLVGAATTSPPDQLWQAVGIELMHLAIIWCVYNLSLRLMEYMERRYVPDLLNTAREILFHRLVQQSQAFLHANFAGVLANHVRRAGDMVNNLRNKFISTGVPLVVRFTVAGILLWQVTPALTLFVYAFALLGVFAAIKTAPRWMALSAAEAEMSSTLTGYIVDSTTNLTAVQQNAGWSEEHQRLDRAHEGMNQAFIKRSLYISLFWGVFDLVATLFFCGFMALVVFGWQHGNVSTAQLAMTVGLVMNLFDGIAVAVRVFRDQFDDFGVLQDALQKISTPLSVMDAPNAPDLKVDKGAIEFRDVKFSYQPDDRLFDGLSFSIPVGQKVGIVGVSGAGKTTLCQLLLRSYDVTGGGIFIDGQNIKDVTLDSLHTSIAVIPQEPVLFHRTLGENIRYGRLSASSEEVIAASKAAEADRFISHLTGGYETLVGERGIKLSGGQRQRVAIARAILKNAPILLLDEATSALDSETERTIQNAMHAAMEGRTTIVVAHRLSTLRSMDRIIVMANGKIIEDGGFDALIAQNGTFARLWELQASGFLPEEIPNS